ncbi:RHS repeat domain-containing protein [Candidatus Enterovibrio escicola]|uniref:RHS repeat domain-containing protein n=1 Tax=Candidatus Enterovibrio escicola TaxID=1927127 RepID=UPI0016804D2D|nr:RHS repeat-associated core domain-containing protein [Candidatus Enterovibrio escacola]
MKNILITIIVALCAAMVAHAETVTYYHTDALGTPVAATDEGGHVLWREHYSPFGEKLDDSQASQSSNVGYTGHQFDSDTGLVYMQARYYDPVIGRFYSNDPISAVEHFNTPNGIHGFNRYAYANNNPYKYIDPDGKSSHLLGVWIGGFIETGTLEGANNAVSIAVNTQQTMAKEAISLTGAGIVVDVVEVTSDVVNSNDPSAQLKGMGVGELTKIVVEKVVDKKLGSETAEAIGTIAGKAVGDTVKNLSEIKVDGFTGAASKKETDK